VHACVRAQGPSCSPVTLLVSRDASHLASRRCDLACHLLHPRCELACHLELEIRSRMPSRISARRSASYDLAHLQDLPLASASQTCRLHALNLITGQNRGAKTVCAAVGVFTSERQVWCEVVCGHQWGQTERGVLGGVPGGGCLGGVCLGVCCPRACVADVSGRR